MNDYYKKLKLTDQKRFLQVGEDLSVSNLSELTAELITELQQLEPFSTGNAEPVFLLPEMTVAEVRRMGTEQQHLMLMVRDRAGAVLRLIAFGAPQNWLTIENGTKINAWVRLGLDEWQGQKLVEGMIEDLRVVF